MRRLVALWLVFFAGAWLSALAGEPHPFLNYAPQPGVFPPPTAGIEVAGELVELDAANRRGGLRLDGDRDESRYSNAPTFRFALLPYAEVRYHGAPADLAQVPLGTRLHGRFLRPPPGDTTIAPQNEGWRWLPSHTHALWIEDDFSFDQHRGRTWQVVACDVAKGRLTLRPQGGDSTAEKADVVHDIDPTTRVWKGSTLVGLDSITPGATVLVNLTWCREWVKHRFRCADIWLDEPGREEATERQRRAHLDFVRHHWLPGWIDSVEPGEGLGGGVVVTLFSGMDPSLYAELRKPKVSANVYAAEPSLRVYCGPGSRTGGEVATVQEIPWPPPGSSGIRIHVRSPDMIEGFRPGRIVRVRPASWPENAIPTEYRIKSLDDR